ncbi:MAG: sulfatase, partial [Verrucomicrobiota bacterium]
KQHQHLFEQMMSYLEEVEARIPKKNPDYDAAAAEPLADDNILKKWGPFTGSRELAEDEKR